MGALRAAYARLQALLLAGATGASVPSASAQEDAVTRAWNAARSTNSVEAYERFLDQHPDSPNSDAAFQALVERSLDASGRAAIRGTPVDMY